MKKILILIFALALLVLAFNYSSQIGQFLFEKEINEQIQARNSEDDFLNPTPNTSTETVNFDSMTIIKDGNAGYLTIGKMVVGGTSITGNTKFILYQYAPSYLKNFCNGTVNGHAFVGMTRENSQSTWHLFIFHWDDPKNPSITCGVADELGWTKTQFLIRKLFWENLPSQYGLSQLQIGPMYSTDGPPR